MNQLYINFFKQNAVFSGHATFTWTSDKSISLHLECVNIENGNYKIYIDDDFICFMDVEKEIKNRYITIEKSLENILGKKLIFKNEKGNYESFIIQ